jgi:hypothetical protein
MELITKLLNIDQFIKMDVYIEVFLNGECFTKKMNYHQENQRLENTAVCHTGYCAIKLKFYHLNEIQTKYFIFGDINKY